MKKLLLTLAAAFTLAGAAFADHEPGHKVLVLKNKDGAAILGYDAVAYFTDNKAVKGSPKIQSEYEGAKYFFVSAEHKAMFVANPAKYAPAYGGYCGYAASIDRLSPISPEWFQIIDGRLVLQHNKKATDLFNQDKAGNVAKADKNWSSLVIRNGTGGKTLVQTDKRGVALEGYDPIAYFTDGKPQKGDANIEATYNGALYHFVSQANRETFEKSPSKYAPVYGGYCGYAASIGKVRPADPLLWSIVDGQLIVQHTKGAVELWEKDVKGNKAKADQFWPKLVEVKGGQKDPVDSLWAAQSSRKRANPSQHKDIETHMKTKIITLTLGLFASAAFLHAQEVATRHSLTMEGAKKVAEAAVAFAKSNGASPSIAVVDEGGHLLYFVRMDGSFVAGVNVSIGKARTSATFKKPTKEFEDIINKGRFTMTALPDFTPLQGGMPIMHEGQVIGAIGVSGAKSAAQDEEVAKAGADVLVGRKLANAQ